MTDTKPLHLTDEDLTTPLHDEIMLWLTDKLQSVPIEVEYLVCPAKGAHESELKRASDFDNLAIWAERKGLNLTAALDSVHADLTWPQSTELTWEFAVPGKNGPVGYIDLLARVNRIEFVYKQNNLRGDYCGTKNCAHDECWTMGTHTSRVGYTAYEVKSSIKSLGELIRQVRKYEAALPWCDHPYEYGQKICRRYGEYADHYTPKFIVVSPDTRWTAPLNSQGITFLEYPSGVYTPMGAAAI